MIVELNKVYILGVPKAASGLTPDEESFVVSGSDDITFAKMNKIEQATKEKPVTSYARVVYSPQLNQDLQFTIFVNDAPAGRAKQLVNDTIKKHEEAAKKAS